MNLKEIRKGIDLLDARILKLLNDRMELALMTKRFKKSLSRVVAGSVRLSYTRAVLTFLKS